MPRAASDTPDIVSLAGALWLLASVIAGRQSDRSNALVRLSHAEQLSGLLADDANHAWTAFGPTNVLVHKASTFAEMGDPYAVLRTAAVVDPESFPQGTQRAAITASPRSRLGTDSVAQRPGSDPASQAGRGDCARDHSVRHRGHGTCARPDQALASSVGRPERDGRAVRNHAVTERTLYLVTCGSPLAARVRDGAQEAVDRNWTPVIVPTQASMAWLDELDLSGVDIVTQQRRPGDVKRAAAPTAIAVVPATFNTLTSWANGLANTYPLATLCAALAQRSRPLLCRTRSTTWPAIQRGSPLSPSCDTQESR